MKNLSEYILERGAAPKVDLVWVVTDKDLEGAILDVCSNEEDAKAAYDKHMKENPDNHLEIKTCERSEVEK